MTERAIMTSLVFGLQPLNKRVKSLEYSASIQYLCARVN